jgi:hypothetical protein
MLGGQNQGPFAGTFDRIAGEGRSPWGSEAAAGDLARSAGIDDVGAGRAADSNERYTGLFDPAADRISLDDSDEASGSDDMDDGGEDV